MAHLLLIRHGETTWNAESRWQGWADTPLSELGEEQARQAAAHLGHCEFARVVSSDLLRARRTAALLAEGLGITAPVEIEPGLRERHVGEWSGLTREEIDARWPGLREAWMRGDVTAPPGGEENRLFKERVVHAVERIAAHADDNPVLVVAHGGVVRALERHAGEEALTLPNLGGRWFEVDRGEFRAGTVVALLDHGTPAAAPVF